MIKIRWIIAAPVIALFLMACGHMAQDISSGNTPSKQCRNQCNMRHANCSSVCVNTFPKCQKKGKREAANSYSNYINEQCIAGKSINRDLGSYYDPLQCTKTTCDCNADLRACKKACTHLKEEKNQNIKGKVV